ncbi:golgin-84 [Selaginella moellendorffii]|uniref:golgin-84 n=1 Tax=Selaginella moellendorffii TaxID=88036 RepID=UPI000D1CDEC5|nr:golgin-84 [Selaginella moellendorffii]|eukprot:XP_024535964.1 golgin-84 [Selaginella moellendorffii]
MASWLRAAEELLEVVDRTAKQAVPVTVSDGGQRKALTSTHLREKTSSGLAEALVKGDGGVENGFYSARDGFVAEPRKSSGAADETTVSSSDERVNCDMTTENGTVSVNLSTIAESTKEKEQPNTNEGKFGTLDSQVEEANRLLQSSATSGKSKEARLAKVCAGLSTRLQELKSENAQLEELLRLEKEAKSSISATLNLLQGELALARSGTNAAESEMAAALASKNSEIEALSISLETANRQAQAAEEKLALVQAGMESIMKNREITETRMIQTLRLDLASAERRVEEERVAHSASRMAAVQREAELEQQMAESTTAVTRMQRIVDERSQKAFELEQKAAMLEVECATLNQELQKMELRARREQKKPSEEFSQSAWREEAERARVAQREAETKLSILEAECQKLRVDLASAKQDFDVSSTQAHIELQKQYKEVMELLFLKQAQLEKVSSEKAAMQFQLEKESKKFRDANAEVERSRRQFSSIGVDDDNELKSFETLGLHQRRMVPSLQRFVGPSIQAAAKFLDSGAVTAGRYLWRRPLARLFVVCYLVFVHFCLMYLLHRLQAKTIEEIEAAAGLMKNG